MREVEDFAAVYDRHRSRVYAQCLRRLRSPADADDATQVTFLRAFTAINAGKGPRRLGPWLATIARNECCDRLSASGRAVPMDVSELALADDGPAPDAGVLAEAEGAEVRAAMEQLPFAQRSVLHLREVEELSYAEVGERLAMPVSAVETLLFRARTNLREEVLAVRAPVKCERARGLGEAVRDGTPITSLERKLLRNHRSDCAPCAWLPVRRARGTRAAAILALSAAAASARRLVVAPVADALVSAGAPAKTAAVAVAAGSVAAGGLAVERPDPRPDRPAAQVRPASQPRAATTPPRSADAARATRPGAGAASRPTAPAAAPARAVTRPAAQRREAIRGETAPAVEYRPKRRETRERSAPPPRRRGGGTPPWPRRLDGGGGGVHRPPPARHAPPAQEPPGGNEVSGAGVREPCPEREASGPGPSPSGGGPGAHS